MCHIPTLLFLLQILLDLRWSLAHVHANLGVFELQEALVQGLIHQVGVQLHIGQLAPQQACSALLAPLQHCRVDGGRPGDPREVGGSCTHNMLAGGVGRQH